MVKVEMNEFARMLVLGAFLVGLLPSSSLAAFDEEFDEKPWEEIEVQLPPFPVDQDLYDFYVSPTAANRFYLDQKYLSVGSDGVVRYILLVVSPSGVRNFTYEGMRCATRERRVYAFGRSDGQWSKAKGNQWGRVREAVTNRHYAALFTDLLCPDGVPPFSVDDIRRVLKREGRPLTERP